jgi:uncharacterized membrane protein
LLSQEQASILNQIMQPATVTDLFEPGTRGKFLAWTHPVSHFLLAAGFLATLATIATKADADWLVALLLLLATGSTLLALARHLPAQNVLMAAFVIAFIGSIAHSVGAKTGIPFGPFMFEPDAGQKIFGTLPWVMPLLWVAAVLNSRGVVRLILRPWRKIRAYGMWLIGLTALLTMLFDCALEPFAAHSKHYWIWMTDSFSLTPHGGPVSNSVGWLAVTLLILAFATPAMINKQLSKRSAPDFQPLAVWLGAIVLFAAGAVMHGFWLAAAADVVISTVVVICAFRGARW